MGWESDGEGGETWVSYGDFDTTRDDRQGRSDSPGCLFAAITLILAPSSIVVSVYSLAQHFA